MLQLLLINSFLQRLNLTCLCGDILFKKIPVFKRSRFTNVNCHPHTLLEQNFANKDLPEIAEEIGR